MAFDHRSSNSLPAIDSPSFFFFFLFWMWTNLVEQIHEYTINRYDFIYLFDSASPMTYRLYFGRYISIENFYEFFFFEFSNI